MAKASWAKVYVDLRHHPKLYPRPDVDKWLWVCLLLHAKEHCPDGIIRGVSPTDMRGMFGIKASVKAIENALAHLEFIEWAVPVDGGIFLPNLEERQLSAGDTPAMHAARQAKWRKTHKRDVTNKSEVTSPSKVEVTSHEKPEVTSRDATGSDAEAEADSDAEAEEAKKIAASAAAPLVPVVEIEPRLVEGWPAPLLAQLKDALASTRRSGIIAPGTWRSFLLKAVGFSPGIRVRAAETYLERACASQGMKENYLLGIMRGENGQAQAAFPLRGPVRQSGIPAASRDEFEKAKRDQQARDEGKTP